MLSYVLYDLRVLCTYHLEDDVTASGGHVAAVQGNLALQPTLHQDRYHRGQSSLVARTYQSLTRVEIAGYCSGSLPSRWQR